MFTFPDGSNKAWNDPFATSFQVRNNGGPGSEAINYSYYHLVTSEYPDVSGETPEASATITALGAGETSSTININGTLPNIGTFISILIIQANDDSNASNNREEGPSFNVNC